MIKFSSENSSRVGTRSIENTEEVSGPNTFQIGTVYVVLAETEDNEDNFLLVKCQVVNKASIDCVYMEKCDGESEHEVFYRQTSEIGKVAKESVHTTLISVKTVNPVDKVYSVDRFEIEEVVNQKLFKQWLMFQCHIGLNDC